MYSIMVTTIANVRGAKKCPLVTLQNICLKKHTKEGKLYLQRSVGKKIRLIIKESQHL